MNIAPHFSYFIFRSGTAVDDLDMIKEKYTQDAYCNQELIRLIWSKEWSKVKAQKWIVE